MADLEHEIQARNLGRRLLSRYPDQDGLRDRIPWQVVGRSAAVATLVFLGLVCSGKAGADAAEKVVCLVLAFSPIAYAVLVWRRPGLFSGGAGNLRWFCLYDNGFVYALPKQEPAAVSWNEVGWVARADTDVHRNFTYTHTVHRTTIGLPDNQVIVLSDEFSDVASISTRIVEEVTRTKLPQVAAALRAGNAVAFPPMSIDRRGITHNDRLLSWGEAAPIVVGHGNVHIMRLGQPRPWATLKAGGFPNLPVFLTVADDMRRAHQRQPPPDNQPG
jgi:hypothetical protein